MANGRWLRADRQMADRISPDRFLVCDLVEVSLICLLPDFLRIQSMPFRFESLTIWHQARAFTQLVHELTRTFPRSEIFALSDQMNRAADAVTLLTAEGSGLPTRALFRHRLGLAQGEVAEIAAASFLALDRSYLDSGTQERVYDAAQSLGRQINAFRNTLS
jgi:four helix bundle protein